MYVDCKKETAKNLARGAKQTQDPERYAWLQSYILYVYEPYQTFDTCRTCEIVWSMELKFWKHNQAKF